MEGEVLVKNLTLEQLDGTVSVVESGNTGGEGGVEPVSVSTEKRTVWEPKSTSVRRPGSNRTLSGELTVEKGIDFLSWPGVGCAVSTASVQVTLGNSCGVTKSLLDSDVPEARISKQCPQRQSSCGLLHPPS